MNNVILNIISWFLSWLCSFQAFFWVLTLISFQVEVQEMIMNIRMMLHFYIIPAGSTQSFDLQWKNTQLRQFRGYTDSQNMYQFSVLCNKFQFSVANCFWSIMRTWLRDMLFVVFFLGTALSIYLFLLFENVMWEAEYIINNILCFPKNAEDNTLYVSHQALL